MATPTIVAPFGTGAPATGAPLPTRPVAGARFIDPITKDYVYEADGSYQRMPTTRQRVLLAVTTVFQSSSVLPDGIKMPRRMGSSWEQKAKVEVERVLRPIIRDGSMKLHGVIVERVTPIGRSRITIAYTDLATGQRDSLQVTQP